MKRKFIHKASLVTAFIFQIESVYCPMIWFIFRFSDEWYVRTDNWMRFASFILSAKWFPVGSIKKIRITNWRCWNIASNRKSKIPTLGQMYMHLVDSTWCNECFFSAALSSFPFLDLWMCTNKADRRKFRENQKWFVFIYDDGVAYFVLRRLSQSYGIYCSLQIKEIETVFVQIIVSSAYKTVGRVVKFGCVFFSFIRSKNRTIP